MTQDPITNWVATTCRALALDPDAVTVEDTQLPDCLYIVIATGARNRLRIIGARGTTLQAIRTLAERMTRRSVLIKAITTAEIPAA